MGDHELAGLLPGGAASVLLFSSPQYDERWAEAELRTTELIGRLQPSGSSEQRRKDVAEWVEGLIYRNFDCKVFTFGSVPLKTYLPDGDIDLTAFSNFHGLNDTWANELCSVLENEEQRKDAKFRVKEVQCIHAEVQIVKCLVENIIVDISFNQLGGLCTLCFLEEVDRLIGNDHLFKRSIILVKAWCYYESRILGAHHGLISTYALETLVLYIFNVFHSSLRGPLEVLFRFLEFFSNFDWDHYCLSLWGPIPLSSLPDMDAEHPQRSGSQLLLTHAFLETCTQVYAVFPGGQDTQGRAFSRKFLNVADPLRINNNLGRSVSKGNFFRIRSAFSYGAKKLERVLHSSHEEVAERLSGFFLNTEKHGSGQRPDAPAPCIQQLQIDSTMIQDVEAEKEKISEGSNQCAAEGESANATEKPASCMGKTAIGETLGGPANSGNGSLAPLGHSRNGEVARPLDFVSALSLSSTKNDTNKGRISSQVEKAKQNAVGKGENVSSSMLEGPLTRGRRLKVSDFDNLNAKGIRRSNVEHEGKTLTADLALNSRGHIQNAKDLASEQNGFHHNDLSNIPEKQTFFKNSVSRLSDLKTSSSRDSSSSTTGRLVASQLPISLGAPAVPPGFSRIPSMMCESSISQRISIDSGSKMNERGISGLNSGERGAQGKVNSDSMNCVKPEDLDSTLIMKSLGTCHIEDRKEDDILTRDEKASISAESSLKSFTVQPNEGTVEVAGQTPLCSPTSLSEDMTFQCRSPSRETPTSTLGSPQRSGVGNNVGILPHAYCSPSFWLPFLSMYNIPVYNAHQILDGNFGSDLGGKPPKRNVFENSLESSRPEALVAGVGETLISAGIPVSAGSRLDTGFDSVASIGLEVKESQDDILEGDFETHLQNLGVGRFYQASYIHGPSFYTPPVMFPSKYIQGHFPWEGPGRPTGANINAFTQILSYGRGIFPGSPVHGGTHVYTAPNGFLGGLPKFRRGTGTYLPKQRPGAYRDRQPVGGGRGQRSSSSSNRHDQVGDGTNNFASKYRGMGRGQQSKHDEITHINRFNMKSDRHRSDGKAIEKAWDTSIEEMMGTNSLQGPSINLSADGGLSLCPPTVVTDLSLRGLPDRENGENTNGFETGCPPVAPVMVHSFVGNKTTTAEELEFGSLGPVQLGGNLGINIFDTAGGMKNSGCISENHSSTKNSEPMQSTGKVLRKPSSNDHQQSPSSCTYELKEEDFPPLPFCGQNGRPTGFNVQKGSANRGSHYQTCVVGPSS